jgi:hypothetical protein
MGAKWAVRRRKEEKEGGGGRSKRKEERGKRKEEEGGRREERGGKKGVGGRAYHEKFLSSGAVSRLVHEATVVRKVTCYVGVPRGRGVSCDGLSLPS